MSVPLRASPGGDRLSWCRLAALSCALITVACIAGRDSAVEPDDIFDNGDGDADAVADADATDVPAPQDRDGGDSDSVIDYDDDGAESDGGSEPTGGRGTMGVCLDGVIQEFVGFQDCEDLECLDDPGCCLDVGRLWVSGDFSVCADLGDCGWSIFPSDSPPVRVESPWLTIGKPTVGEEVGVYSEPLVELRGGATLTFAAALSAEGCTAESCRQILGVSLTEQESLSSGTGVIPSVGIVIDGESSRVHYVVDGAVVASDDLSQEELTTPWGYAVRLGSDGSLSFYRQLPLDWIGTDPRANLEGEADATVRQGSISSSALLRLVLHGRFSEEGEGMLGGVVLRQPVCDVPDGFVRKSPYAVLRSDDDASHVGGPSVVYRYAEADMLMVYELDHELAVATSSDGFEWVPQGLILTGHSPTNYGVVARRAPSVLAPGLNSSGASYHLWFEGVSEFAGIPAGESPKRAIVHATSSDGLFWEEADDGSSVVLTGSEAHDWRGEVAQPSVEVMEDGSLLMVFVGINPIDGSTAFGRGVSSDWSNWSVSEGPIGFASDPLPFERDGVADPMVVRRGSLLHLWYTGSSGSRSSIGYAVGISGGGDWLWHRYGPVIEPNQPWESQRVAAPAVLVHPGDELVWNLLQLELWYEGGLRERGRIGAASREIPGEMY